MTNTTLFHGVSFARTPLEEISAKWEEIKALGWREREGESRGNPWAISITRDVSEEDADAAIAEVTAVMGTYWLEPKEMRELNESARG